MSNSLPSRNLSLLKKLLGNKIVSVKRQLFQGDTDLVDYEQNADGPVELVVSDGSVVHFVADSETFSVGVVPGKMPRYGDSYNYKDLSDNFFWHNRVGQEIKQLVIFKSPDYSTDYPSEFGIEILFANKKKVLIEYRDEEDYPDMIRVAGRYSGQSCVNQLVE